MKKILIGVTVILSLLLLVIAFKYFQNPAKINLSANGNFQVTADTQDSLGVAPNTQFTITSDTDIDESDLKNSLVLFPDTDFSIKVVSSRQFTIIPKQILEPNKIYKVQIKTNEKDFSWAFQTKNDFRVVQTFPRDKSTSVPTNTGVELVFSHENWEDPKDFFTITPAISGRFERHKRTISFIPKSFVPGTLYTVKLKKGLKLKGTSEVLKNDFSFQFETASPNDSSQQLNLSKKFYEFSPADIPAFDIFLGENQSQNLKVSVYQYPTEAKFLESFRTKLSVPTWAYYTSKNQSINTATLSKISSFEAPVQKQTYTNYFMLPELLPVGLYLVEVGNDSQKTQALFQVTNISAYFTQSGNKTLVWVNDTNSSKPIQNAKVGYLENNNETNESGIAYFDTNPQDIASGNTAITVKHSSGTLFIPLQDQSSYFYSQNYQSQGRERDKYWSYLYQDRPTYLPEDTLKFWGLLKLRDNPTKKFDLTLEVTKTDFVSGDYTPIVIFQKDLKTNDLGTFLSEIPLKGVTPGWYSLELKLAGVTVLSSGFSVETYTKPAYKITLTPSSKAVITGASVTVAGQANFFEGSPVAGLELKESNYQSDVKTTFVSDNQGQFSFASNPKTDPVQKYSPQYKYYSVVPTNPEEAQISANTTVAIFESSQVFTYPQTEVKDGLGKVTLDLRKVDLQKYTLNSDFKKIFDPAIGSTIKAVVYELSWNKREVGTYYDFINKKTTPRYEYDQIKNKLTETSFVTDSTGQAIYNLAIPEDKSYEIQLEATDDQSRTTYQTAYLGGSTGQPYTNNFLSIKTAKTGEGSNQYQVGEQVNLTLYQGDKKLLATSNDQFLFILSQRGIRSYHFSKDGTLSFKYPEEFSPNINVQAIRFSGKTYQASDNLFLNFDTAIKKLNLKISLDKTNYLPGETAKVSVTTTDYAGKPVSTEVNLNMVDEAYYNLYSEDVNTLNSLYRHLGSDILVSYLSHQYPVDQGGAEGGGGGGGSLFRDTAFFGSLTTNSQGQGSIDVKLPDNLTSWRLTAQAISQNLQAGAASYPLIVKLPFFVTAIVNNEYLTEDSPIIFVRAFGEALQTDDVVNLKVDSPTLGLSKTFAGKSYEPISVSLGKLTTGDHKIVLDASSAKGSYKLERTIKVLDSRLKYSQSKYQKLSDQTKLIGSPDTSTKIIFSDENIGQFYTALLEIASTWGDRLDQKMARSLSQSLIKKYFDDQTTIEKVNANPYQTPDGGLAIYPYASSDLEVTAFQSALSKDNLNQAALKNYFYQTLSKSEDTLTIAKSLFGIASLNEPVLLQINSLLEDKKLNPVAQIYLGLALAEIGDTERASSLYSSILQNYKKTEDSSQYIQVGKDKDDVLKNTILVADLGALLNEPESVNFLRYVLTNSTKDVLLVSQKILALTKLLEKTSPEPVSFDYELNGKTTNVKLEKGKTLKLILSPESLSKIVFSRISGQVGVTSSFLTVPNSSTQTNNTVSISRSYTTKDVLTNQFNNSDLVKVSLNINHAEVSQDGCYQITDLLPSGLKVVTTPYTLGLPTTNIYYPYEINGQRVSFCVSKNSVGNTINYYARVINSGKFKAESSLIQSLISPSVFNFSDPAEIYIK